MGNEIEICNLDIIPVQEIKAQINAIKELMTEVMVETTKENPNGHYGKIPGCGDKPTLLKAGAEKLALCFKLDLETVTEVIDLGPEHREYRCVTTVYSKGTGLRLGNGAGCCTTMESKWRYRTENTGAEVPSDYWKTRDSSLLGGSEYTPRKVYIDNKSKWMIFHKVEHDNPADYYNTCQKMAEKRSKVCAVLNVTAASDIFTQDVEDIAEKSENGTGKKKPEVRKTGSKSQGKDHKATIKIKEVSSQSGDKKGKPWTKYFILSIEGVIYSTFSNTIGEDAKTLEGTDVEVIVWFKTDKYGNTINDNGFEIQEGEKDA